MNKIIDQVYQILERKKNSKLKYVNIFILAYKFHCKIYQFILTYEFQCEIYQFTLAYEFHYKIYQFIAYEFYYKICKLF